MSVFMLGLPVGIALSYAVSGTVTKYFGWRSAFFVAGIPGIAVAIAVLFIREPERGSGDAIWPLPGTGPGRLIGGS